MLVEYLSCVRGAANLVAAELSPWRTETRRDSGSQVA